MLGRDNIARAAENLPRTVLHAKTLDFAGPEIERGSVQIIFDRLNVLMRCGVTSQVAGCCGDLPNRRLGVSCDETLNGISQGGYIPSNEGNASVFQTTVTVVLGFEDLNWNGLAAAVGEREVRYASFRKRHIDLNDVRTRPAEWVEYDDRCAITAGIDPGEQLIELIVNDGVGTLPCVVKATD